MQLPSLVAPQIRKGVYVWWLMRPLCFNLNWTSFSESIQLSEPGPHGVFTQLECLQFPKFHTFQCMFAYDIFCISESNKSVVISAHFKAGVFFSLLKNILLSCYKSAIKLISPKCENCVTVVLLKHYSVCLSAPDRESRVKLTSLVEPDASHPDRKLFRADQCVWPANGR